MSNTGELQRKLKSEKAPLPPDEMEEGVKEYLRQYHKYLQRMFGHITGPNLVDSIGLEGRGDVGEVLSNTYISWTNTSGSTQHGGYVYVSDEGIDVTDTLLRIEFIVFHLDPSGGDVEDETGREYVGCLWIGQNIAPGTNLYTLYSEGGPLTTGITLKIGTTGRLYVGVDLYNNEDLYLHIKIVKIAPQKIAVDTLTAWT